MADGNGFHRGLVKGHVLLYQVEFHSRQFFLRQNPGKIDRTGAYGRKPALRVHVLDMPGLEPPGRFVEICNGVGAGLGDPVQVHLEIEIGGIRVFDEIIHRNDTLGIFLEFEIVVVIQAFQSGSRTFLGYGIDNAHDLFYVSGHAQGLRFGVELEMPHRRNRDHEILEPSGFDISDHFIGIVQGNVPVVGADRLQPDLGQIIFELDRLHAVELAVGIPCRFNVFIADIGHRFEDFPRRFGQGISQGIQGQTAERCGGCGIFLVGVVRVLRSVVASRRVQQCNGQQKGGKFAHVGHLFCFKIIPDTMMPRGSVTEASANLKDGGI